MSIDEILDKIARFGINSLTQEERDYLEENKTPPDNYVGGIYGRFNQDIFDVDFLIQQYGGRINQNQNRHQYVEVFNPNDLYFHISIFEKTNYPTIPKVVFAPYYYFDDNKSCYNQEINVRCNLLSKFGIKIISIGECEFDIVGINNRVNITDIRTLNRFFIESGFIQNEDFDSYMNNYTLVNNGVCILNQTADNNYLANEIKQIESNIKINPVLKINDQFLFHILKDENLGLIIILTNKSFFENNHKLELDIRVHNIPPLQESILLKNDILLKDLTDSAFEIVTKISDVSEIENIFINSGFIKSEEFSNFINKKF